MLQPKIRTDWWQAERTEIDILWDRVKDRIQAAMDRTGQYDAADVRKLLLAGDWQLWVGWHEDTIDCVVLTTIVKHPKSQECIILVATGDHMENWWHHVREIEGWAKYMECDRMKLFARPGWERVLKDYKRTHVQLEKVL